MKIRILAACGLALVVFASVVEAAGPVQRIYRQRYSENVAWHGAYYDPAWSGPVALVVPPTAEKQTKWSWGVANTEVVPINHQFRRAWPGPYNGGGPGFLPKPYWPGHTDEFGVYYVRAPW